MTQPPAGMPPPMPVSRPASPTVVNIATALLLVTGVIWLFFFLYDASLAQAEDPNGPTPPTAYVALIHIVLVLLAWAGRDTRAGMIAVLVYFAIFFLGIPLFAVIQTAGDLPPSGVLLILTSAALFAAAVVGVRLLFRPEAKDYFLQSRAFRTAGKAARRRR